jgi:hypothetical protein
MKKIFLLVLAVAVVFSLPLTAQAKVDFELGGFIRMDMMWNSQGAASYTLASFATRDNVLNGNHGKFMMNANASRFNFTLKGPEVWGGKVTGFMEFDFDGQPVTTTVGPNSTVDSPFIQGKIRLRHAMFKIAYPDREFLFGQYWSINSELIPETADSGGYCLYGATQLRIPQVRYTQKFMDGFDGSITINAPQSGRWGVNVDAANPAEGETSETPMVEAKLRFEQDLYGKAAWYGKPRAFYVGLGAGYFRSRSVPTQYVNSQTQNYSWNGAAWALADPVSRVNSWVTLGQTNWTFPRVALPGLGTLPAVPGPLGYFSATTRNAMNVRESNYANHWLFLIENFTPIIPTLNKDLSGSLGLAHQWWIGQGVSAWRLDLPGNDRYYRFAGNNAAANTIDYDMTFIKRYGGWAQLQYYFTNEIFTNLNFGFEKGFGFDQQRNPFAPGGYSFACPYGFDPVKTTWRAGVTQWYRPVPAIKFAVQYTWMRTEYYQTTQQLINNSTTNYLTQASPTTSNSGNNHSVMANAWYMF